MSPLKIGFIASFVFHTLLIAMVTINLNEKKISAKSDYTISINLSNVANTGAGSQEIQQYKKKEKKQHKKKKDVVKKNIPNKTITKNPKQEKEVVEETTESAESNIESNQQDTESNNFNDSQNANFGGGGIQTLDNDSELFAMIKKIIEKHNQYPRMARKREIEGNVVVEFVLFKNGEISDIKILNNAHNTLNQGAINAIKRSYKEFPSIDNNVKIKIIISYNLI
ncbi:hypothetical protein CCY99_03020 [Helicobacter sp. 16-1353]|uniref:energy transducer TonB n=1 Tax=Helicobacter sp. 16-1353 TaxID=2004996 RepID=UPI000DCE4D31|nr:TonB family protein [Helicobacter sp. 16-1353]RAX54748.1 hypothetical protein CCY99_03020 [Helicobacter sp. 16-1353]